MKALKSAWLETVFTALILVVVIVSIRGTLKGVPVSHERRLEQSEKTIGTMSLADYIKAIKAMGNCTAVFAVKDIQGYYLQPEDAEALKELGFDQAGALLEQEYHSFIGIWSAGEAVYQCVGGDEAISHGQLLNGHYVYAMSATQGSGNTGEIFIDDIQCSVNNRGVNVVVIDNAGFSLIDSVAYDVYAEDVPVYRLADGKAALIEATRES